MYKPKGLTHITLFPAMVICVKLYCVPVKVMGGQL